MATDVFKSAIVGCGGIAAVHAEVLSSMDNINLIAFADIKPERAKRFAEKYGGRAYSSLEEMLSHEEPDVLHICTPHYLHTPMAELAAEKGINVFTEKPPVIDAEQWERFKAIENKARVGVCFQNRYNKSVACIHRLLESGTPGEILGARAFVTWHREAPYYTESGWRGSLKTEGGGALINQSIHTLDLLVQFMGRANKVDATVSNHHLKGVIEVEDTVEAYIDFSGKPALFYASTANVTDSPVMLELNCENAVIRMEEQEVTVKYNNGTKECISFAPEKSPATGKPYWGASHGKCIADFYACLTSGKRFKNDIPGIADTAELMLALYRSARTGKNFEEL